jgi:hypothetical protein
MYIYTIYLSYFSISNNKMALMGTSVGIPTASAETKVVFVEDLSVAEAAKIGAVVPPGLENLGIMSTIYIYIS